MFFETTIMGNTADLAMVQKTIIDTLHKEGKSQRAITERGDCSRSGLSKHIKCKVDWKELGREMCTSNRDDRKLENTVKQSRFKHLGELHKEWTEAGVSASRVTTLRHLQEKGYRFCREARNPCCLKSSVKFPVSDGLGCNVICWCWSTVFSEVHSQRSHLSGHFRALHASFCWQALWRCWFNFLAGLGTCPHCQRYQKLVYWPWCYCAWLASKLAWPEPHRESMGYCQEED